jgi:hypothetical protein
LYVVALWTLLTWLGIGIMIIAFQYLAQSHDQLMNTTWTKSPKLMVPTRDENRSDMDGYHWYYICFHISAWIQIRIRIVLTIPDRIQLDINIINMWFEYSDMDTISDVEYLDSDMDRFKPL